MRLCIDIETDALNNPKKIWCICCKDIDKGDWYVFRNLTDDGKAKAECLVLLSSATVLIGHNIVSFDLVVLKRLLGFDYNIDLCLDTYILSKLIDYPRSGHSIEDYGLEFDLPKITFTDFSKWSEELELYCKRDVEIAERIVNKYHKYTSKHDHLRSIRTEHKLADICNSLHDNGFYFDGQRARKLLANVERELEVLDKDILTSFPPKYKLIRVVEPRLTKHGTLNRNDFRFEKSGDLSCYNGGPFSLLERVPFNPSSHKQIIDILTESGWKPTDKTKTHVIATREGRVDDQLRKYGWKVNEHNISSLPKTAPEPARALARRILYESRRRTLTEWLSLIQDDDRIHGHFHGIGAWTHRMSHQHPNTANIPNEYDTAGNIKLLGGDMRGLWRAPKGRLLVGVDAESIQLRIFAHYINDPEFTKSLVEGRKDDKTDPHSLNQRILGRVCKSRAAAKRFIYALLLGAGMSKLSEVLECSNEETEQALNLLMARYTGFAALKQTIIPKDATNGWFKGLDGRRVKIPGESIKDRRHLAMSGYLQSGEAIVTKNTIIKVLPQLPRDVQLVNFVHDEYIFEIPNDVSLGEEIIRIVDKAIIDTGEELQLKCPLKGDGKVGTTWLKIH